MIIDTFRNIVVQIFLGKKFIPRFAKFLLIFPYYLACSIHSKDKISSSCPQGCLRGGANRPLAVEPEEKGCSCCGPPPGLGHGVH